MKININGEKITDTLDKCGIVYNLTYEEMNQIISEEILREKVRAYIRSQNGQSISWPVKNSSSQEVLNCNY